MDDRHLEIEKAFRQPEWYLKTRNYHVRIRTEIVRELLSKQSAKRILDIGCGDGSISLPLLRPDNNLTLLDISDSMLDRAKARIPNTMVSQVQLMKGEFMNSCLDKNSYDLIICVGVLAYVDELQSFISKLASHLEPEGTIIIEWTDEKHFIRRIQSPYHRLRAASYGQMVRLAERSSAEIINQFKTLGFEIAGSYRYCSPLPIFRRLLSQNLSFKMIRAIHGDVRSNTGRWLGDECIYQFQLKTAYSRCYS